MIDLRSPRPERVAIAAPDPEPFSLDALATAVAELDPGHLEHHRAVDLPMLLPDGQVERASMSVADVIRGIDDGDSWVMLRGLASLERYRPATLQVSAPLQLAARAAGETPIAVELLVFVASGNTRVPFHCDIGHHVLLQLEGTKTLVFGWYDDPEVEHAVLVDSVGRGRTNPDRMPDRIEEMVLGPGEAVVLPAFCFHGVTDCTGRSVALTAVLRTDVTREKSRALEAERAQR